MDFSRFQGFLFCRCIILDCLRISSPCHAKIYNIRWTCPIVSLGIRRLQIASVSLYHLFVALNCMVTCFLPRMWNCGKITLCWRKKLLTYICLSCIPACYLRSLNCLGLLVMTQFYSYLVASLQLFQPIAIRDALPGHLLNFRFTFTYLLPHMSATSSSRVLPLEHLFGLPAVIHPLTVPIPLKPSLHHFLPSGLHHIKPPLDFVIP